MFEGITPLHLLLVLIIALIILGPGKLPEVGTALGKGIREFRRATSDIREATSLDRSPSNGAAPLAVRAAPAPEPAGVAAPAVAPAPVTTESTGAALGKGIREFRRATSDIREATSLDPSPAPAVPIPQPLATAPAPATAAAPEPGSAPTIADSGGPPSTTTEL
jgi:TatA/E family protein of Tat protein translocase